MLERFWKSTSFSLFFPFLYVESCTKSHPSSFSFSFFLHSSFFLEERKRGGCCRGCIFPPPPFSSPFCGCCSEINSRLIFPSPLSFFHIPHPSFPFSSRKIFLSQISKVAISGQPRFRKSPLLFFLFPINPFILQNSPSLFFFFFFPYPSFRP